MEWLALSIFVSTVLYLVDKNHAWSGFWRFSKWACAVMLLAFLGLGGYYAYQQHQNPPKTLPANFSNWDK